MNSGLVLDHECANQVIAIADHQAPPNKNKYALPNISNQEKICANRHPDQGGADTRGVGSDEVVLECRSLLGGDRHVREPTEAGRDSVDRFSREDPLLDEGAERGNARARADISDSLSSMLSGNPTTTLSG